MRMGMARLMSSKCPNMTFPRMAPTLPIPEWTPNAVDLQNRGNITHTHEYLNYQTNDPFHYTLQWNLPSRRDNLPTEWLVPKSEVPLSRGPMMFGANYALSCSLFKGALGFALC